MLEQSSEIKIPTRKFQFQRVFETLSTLVPTGLIKYYFPIKIHVCMKNYVSNAQGINKSSCIWTEKPTTFDFLLPRLYECMTKTETQGKISTNSGQLCSQNWRALFDWLKEEQKGENYIARLYD